MRLLYRSPPGELLVSEVPSSKSNVVSVSELSRLSDSDEVNKSWSLSLILESESLARAKQTLLIIQVAIISSP